MSTTTRGDLSVTDAEASHASWYHGFRQAATTKYWAAAARISIGFIFLWAFLDKNFGWQFTTPKGQGWMFATGDGSPTFGFLTFGTNPDGPFAGVFNNLGEQAGVASADGPPTLYPGSWVNWMFMLALLGIGISLMLGFMVRIGSIGGAVLLGLMWLAEAPWANTIDPETGQGAFNNPFMDEHIIYAITLIMLMLFTAERTWGLGKWWESTSLVQRFPWLA
jgi:thiosulfate dehydrogenase [quinone] large subunit